MKKYRMFKETFLGEALIWAMTYLMILLPVSPVLALPTGQTVVNGDVTFTQNGNTMVVNQTSGRAIVNYDGFNIAGGEGVRFAQPDSSAAILNRVTGAGSSTIAGQLSANGRVFLVNPNGVLFTSSAQVDVGALVASALNISDSDFLAGNLKFAGGSGSVVNEGVLSGSSVYLVGRTVENRGVINASDVVLAAGSSVLIDHAGDGQIRVTIDGEVSSSNALANGTAGDPSLFETSSGSNSLAGAGSTPGLTNSANQVAQGSAAGQLLGTVMNQGTINASGDVGGTVLAQGTQVGQFGTINANGLVGNGGQITLHASDVVVLSADSRTTANAGLNGNGGQITVVGENAATIATGARIEAKGGTLSGNGGFVETSGKQSFQIGSTPDVSASHGRGGTWLIDPNNITITNVADHVNLDTNSTPWVAANTGSWVSVSQLTSALNFGDVTIVTSTNGANNESGDITLASVLNYGGTNTATLTLNAHNNIYINQAINSTGTNLNLSLNANTNSGFGAASGTGSVYIAANIDLHGGDITLTAGGAIAQTNGTITANNLGFDAATSVRLGSLHVNNVAGSAGGAITLTNSSSLTVINAFGHTGLYATNGNITIVARGGGDLNLVAGVNAGSSNIIMTAAGDISQTSGALTAGGLSFVATNGAVTMSNTNNDIATASGRARNSIKLYDLNGMFVGGVTSTVGSVEVEDAGTLGLGNVGAPNGSVNVTAGGAITGGTVSASTLYALATSNINLSTAINVLSATSQVGSIAINDASGLMLSNVLANQSISVTAGGAMTALVVTAVSGDISLVNTRPVRSPPYYYDVELGDVRATNGTVVVRSDNRINGHNVAGGVDVTASNLEMYAYYGIGSYSAVKLSVGSIFASNSLANNIAISNNYATGSAISGLYSAGTIDYVQALGDLSINGAVYSISNGVQYGGDINISASGRVILGPAGEVKSWGPNMGAWGGHVVNNAIGVTTNNVQVWRQQNNQGNGPNTYTYGSIQIIGHGSIPTNLVILSGADISNNYFFAYEDIVIGTNVNLGSSVYLLADYDTNGTGGVWIESSGSVSSSDGVKILGSHLVTNDWGYAVLVEGGITATNDVTIDSWPNGGDICISNGVISSISGGLIDIWAQNSSTLCASAKIKTAGSVKVEAANGNILLSGVIDPSSVSLIASNGSVTVSSNVVATDCISVYAGTNVNLTSFGTLNVTGGGSNAITAKVGSIALDGYVSAIGGSVVLIAGSNIVQTSGELISSNLVFSADNGAVTLTNVNNDVDIALGRASGSIALVDANGILLGAVTATNALGVEARNGDITQTVVDKVYAGGVSTLKASGDIALTNAANDFVGAVNASGTNVDLVDANSIQLGEVAAAGTLGVEAKNGNITQTVADKVVVGGVATLKAAGDITLANAANDFKGAVNATGVNVSLVDANGIVLGAVTATNALGVEARSGNITQTVVDKVYAGGVSTLKASGDIALTNAANDFVGAVNASGVNVALVDTNSIVLGAVTATNALGVEARSGNITQTVVDKVVVGGVATLKATGDITLANVSNDFSSVVGSAGGSIALADVNDIVLTSLTTTAGNISVNAGGTIVADNVVAGGVSTIKLLATNSGDIVIGNVVSGNAVSGGSNICIIAANNVYLTNGVAPTVQTYGNGAIAIWAQSGIVTQSAGSIKSVDGNIYISGSSVYQNNGAAMTVSGSGALAIYASNTMVLAGTDTAKNLALGTGVGDITVNGTMTIVDTAVLSAGHDIKGSGKVVASKVGLKAKNNIGAKGSSFQVDAGTLATAAQNVYVKELSDVASGSVSMPVSLISGRPNCATNMPIPDTSGLESGNIYASAYLDLDVKGKLSGTTVKADGDANIKAGSIDDLEHLDVGHDALLNVEGGTTISTIDTRGVFNLHGGRDFTFKTLNAGSVQVEVGGGIAMGQVTSGTANFKAGGSVRDNNSMLNVNNITIQAGGDIGSEPSPINLNSVTIDNVTGGNIYLKQSRAGALRVNTINARGDLHLSVPNGQIYDAQNDGDILRNGATINITAAEAQFDAEQIGERSNPLDVDIPGTITLRNTSKHPDPRDNYIWAHISNKHKAKVDINYNDKSSGVPGLVIENNQVVGGQDGVMREIFRTEAFFVETPELKSKQGVFGSPYFLNSFLNINEPVAIDLIHYMLYIQAKVNIDPVMPGGNQTINTGSGGTIKFQTPKELFEKSSKNETNASTIKKANIAPIKNGLSSAVSVLN